MISFVKIVNEWGDAQQHAHTQKRKKERKHSSQFQNMFGRHGRALLRFRNSVSAHHKLACCGIVLTTMTTFSHHKSMCDPVPKLVVPVVPTTTTLEHKVTIEKPKSDGTLLQRAMKMLRYCRRLLDYLIFGVPIAFLAPTAYALQTVSPKTEDLLWSYAIWAIEQLGPTFIKFAQWASTRPDLYPPQLIQRLRRLQDDVSVHHPMSTVEKTLTEAFGEKWKGILELDPSPLGATSLTLDFPILHHVLTNNRRRMYRSSLQRSFEDDGLDHRRGDQANPPARRKFGEWQGIPFNSPLTFLVMISTYTS